LPWPRGRRRCSCPPSAGLRSHARPPPPLDRAPGFFGVDADELVDAMHQRVREPSLTATLRHSSFVLSSLAAPFALSATRRAAPGSGRRFSTTSSTRSRKPGRDRHNAHMPALTMPMSMPALIALVQNTCGSPRAPGALRGKLKLTLLTPPDTLAPGQFCLIQRVASMKSTAVVVVLFDAVRWRRCWSKMIPRAESRPSSTRMPVPRAQIRLRWKVSPALSRRPSRRWPRRSAARACLAPELGFALSSRSS